MDETVEDPYTRFGWEPDTELRAVMLDNHDPVGPKVLHFAQYAQMMADWEFPTSQIREQWERWPVVVFPEQA
jgi:hypothetical protein